MKYKFFYKGSPFSNFYKAKFKYGNTEFRWVEQFMMFHKAILFKDFDIAKNILEANNPALIKKLGRQVKNYNDKIWISTRYNVVKEGAKLKFTQNPDLLKILKKYKGYQFIEAAKNDRVWGIGYSENDAMDNINNWGQNLLGKILTELCKEL